MEIKKCPCCGGTIDETNYSCMYCGTKFEKEKPITQTQTETVEKVVTTKKEYTKMTAEELSNQFIIFRKKRIGSISKLVAPFMSIAILVVVALTVFGDMQLTSTMFEIPPVFKYMPYIIIGIGCLSILNNTFNKPSSRCIKRIALLLRENKVDEAFNLAKDKAYKYNVVEAASVLIAFYVKQDYVYATTHLPRVRLDTFNSYERCTDILHKVTYELNYTIPTRYESYSHTRSHTGHTHTHTTSSTFSTSSTVDSKPHISVRLNQITNKMFDDDHDDD